MIVQLGIECNSRYSSGLARGKKQAIRFWKDEKSHISENS